MSGSKVAIVLAATALIVSVLVGTPLGQAASRFVLPKNSVGAAQIKKSAVGNKKIANNAITSLKVKDGSLLAADFGAGQLARGPQGPQGPKGDPGPQGQKGATGARGLKGDAGATHVTRRIGTPGADAAPGSLSNASASCLPGETLVGGGGAGYDTWAGGKPTLAQSLPDDAGHWFASVRNDGVNGTVKAYAYALCASP